jgi:hypothetical protein
MDPSLVQYLGFLVAVLIIIWGIVELGRRHSRREKVSAKAINNWVKFDPHRKDAVEETLPEADNYDQEEKAEADMRARAQQNGHYSESKKLL